MVLCSWSCTNLCRAWGSHALFAMDEHEAQDLMKMLPSQPFSQYWVKTPTWQQKCSFHFLLMSTTQKPSSPDECCLVKFTVRFENGFQNEVAYNGIPQSPT